jgi:diguanylate cyclase (GGDEF)-like protein
LTGLSNRRRFDNWLATVPATDRATAMLLIDLDDFKDVNDLHGHAVGDEALRRVGRLVAGHVRPGDLALRLGGDEFAVIVVDEHDPDADDAVEVLHATARHRADALRDAVAMTDWDRIASGLTVRLSVGVAATVLGPGAPGAADRLYREADRQLYAAKAMPEASAG